MPATKTLEQLTAKYEEFRAPNRIQNWVDYGKCSDHLVAIAKEIHQQRNQEKKRGLERFRDELRARRDEAKARLPPKTRFGAALDDAEMGTDATDADYKESGMRMAQALRVVKKEAKVQKALVAKKTGHLRDAVAVGRALRAGEKDEEWSAADDDAPEALVDAPAPKARTKAKAASAPAAASASVSGCNFMDWSDDAMVAFLDADVCNFVAWSKEEVAERRDQLKEAYDVPSLVRVIKLRLPAFKNNRQKRETLVRKLITLSPSDADTLWRLRYEFLPATPPSILRQRVVCCGVCGEQFHGGRGHQLHTCESCESVEPESVEPESVEPEAKRSRLEDNASGRSSKSRSSSRSSKSSSNKSTKKHQNYKNAC